MRPGLRAPIVLESDKDQVPAPTFFARALTMDEQLEVGGVLDRLIEDPDVTTAQLHADACAMLEKVIDSWEHMQEPFAFKLLSYFEARELLRRVAYSQGLDFIEKKS